MAENHAKDLQPGLYHASCTDVVDAIRHLDQHDFYLTVNGKVVDVDELGKDDFFYLNFRLLGGKGGFGSLLKSFRIHKSSNQLMCRDLSGRRLADIKEEERLRRWISRREERENKKKVQEEEKLNKLKTGVRTKHQFNDAEYMRRREQILDDTEDAIEAGLQAEREKLAAVESKSASDTDTESDEEEFADLEAEFALFCAQQRRKRKKTIDAGDSEPSSSRPRLDDIVSGDEDEDDDDEATTESTSSSGSAVEAPRVPPVPPKEKPKPREPQDFPAIDLSDFEDVKQLEELGLDHLRHALEARGLKCGGSLAERATRLFSVKGLTPEQYPKKLKSLPKK